MSYERLKLLREQKGWSLADLERRTGVRSQVLGLIDRGDFGALPRGLYGRAAVRAYASAVGLPAEEILEQLHDQLPGVEDPLDGLARVRGLARRPSRQPEPAAPTVERPPDAESIAWWRPLAASAIDAALLGSIQVVLVCLTAVALDTTVSSALTVAAPAILVLFTLIGSLYFLLLGGVRNATIGSRLAGLDSPPAEQRALDLQTVVARARRSALRETSEAVACITRTDGAQRALRALRLRRA